MICSNGQTPIKRLIVCSIHSYYKKLHIVLIKLLLTLCCRST